MKSSLRSADRDGDEQPDQLRRPYAHSAEQVLSHLNVDRHGLSWSGAEERLQKYGRNELPEDPPTPIWELILEQFKDKLVIILLASAALSFVLALVDHSDGWTAFVDPIVMLSILVLNAVVGVSQEVSAEKAIAALPELIAQKAKVIRDGSDQTIEAGALVPGDIVNVAKGDRVPADCRIVSVLTLGRFSVNESALTGESKPVSKTDGPIKMAEPDGKAQIIDQNNMLFMGTEVCTGLAVAVVVGTGTSTERGEIHTAIAESEGELSPLKQKLNDFGDSLAVVISIICLVVWIINIPHFGDVAHGSWLNGAIYYLKIAVSLGVAAIPEGLAVVITTCLALGSRRMADNNVVVRHIDKAEALGSCTVICSDKTGTLTTHQMTVTSVSFLRSSAGSLMVEDVGVTGTGYSPTGQLATERGSKTNLKSSQLMAGLCQVSALCNDAKLFYNNEIRDYAIAGDPTEGALCVLVEKIGNTIKGGPTGQTSSSGYMAELAGQYKIANRFEFSSIRKRMSVLVMKNGPVSHGQLLVKGAPEHMLDQCTNAITSHTKGETRMDSDLKRLILSRVKDYAREGLRVLAVARRDQVDLNHPDFQHTSEDQPMDRIESGLTFIGLVAMSDPARPEVPASVAKCQSANIRVVMVTGDNEETAKAIGRNIGLFPALGDGDDKSEVLCYTGQSFDKLRPAEKVEAARHGVLFSRMNPIQKLELVSLMQKDGEVVAMTGDGVNDAPALKQADIGIAMGSGTDVARNAAAMVLMDNNFATIVLAVELGRTIFSNAQQFVRYLISSNIGEVVSIFLTAALGMPEALVPVQLLWVNLVTDGLPATALSFNPADKGIMTRRPRNRKDGLVDGWLLFRYVVIGTYVGVATVAGYAWWFLYYDNGPQITFSQLRNFHTCSTNFPEIGCAMFSDGRARAASTVSLSVLVVIEMFNALNALSSSESLLSFPPWKNMMLIWAIACSIGLHLMLLYVPFFQSLFQISALNQTEWWAVVLLSGPIILIDEVLKIVERKVVIKQDDRPVGHVKME